MIALLVPLAAAAGYGVPVDGFPSAGERWLVLWTNGARVAPEEYTDEYAAGGCSTDDFSEDELTPKAPLYIDLALTEVARVHSADMEENGCFQHESCDGTDTWARIGQYYDDAAGAMGENIAMGSDDGRYAVLSMWMCSHSGHRANIMSGSFNEMGGGISGVYQTQDFAYGELKEGDPPVRVAAEEDGAWWADWGDDAPPAALSVVVDGIETPLALAHGTPEQGLYTVSGPEELGTEPCHHAYVYWKTEAGESGTFPEEGSFAAGDCDELGDDDTSWSPEHPLRNGLFGDVADEDLDEAMVADLSIVGCATGGRAGAAWLPLAVAGLLVFRRVRA